MESILQIALEKYHAEYGGHNVDAALTPIFGRFYNVGVVLIGKVVGWGVGFVGNGVRKMGAATGVSNGVISSTTFTWKTTDPIYEPITLTR